MPKKNKKTTEKLKPLIPVDLKRCQTEISNGVNFMTLGGRREMVRCENKPVVIATETTAGDDGQHGSMSLCAVCLVKFLTQTAPGFATFKEV